MANARAQQNEERLEADRFSGVHVRIQSSHSNKVVLSLHSNTIEGY